MRGRSSSDGINSSITSDRRPSSRLRCGTEMLRDATRAVAAVALKSCLSITKRTSRWPSYAFVKHWSGIGTLIGRVQLSPPTSLA
ncbi:hypothetical protein NXC24_PC01707 (plasmid) [Rhizobium sp. NXC24]|nr:hypothetical protein NXC24_PC01707 [Rhizobium sp. NXC24]